VQLLVPEEIKSRQPLSIGLTDSLKRNIGAFSVLLLRDDVKCAKAKSSAPVEPMTIGAMTLARNEECNGHVTFPESPI